MDPAITLNNIFNQNQTAQKFGSLATIVSGALDIIFSLAGFALLIWLVWGAVQYILSGGDKEKLAKARSRLLYAVIGFVIIVLSFTIKGYIQNILPGVPSEVPKVEMRPEGQFR